MKRTTVFVFLTLITNTILVFGQSNFKITYPYSISSLNVENNKLLVGDDQGFVELDTALNLIREYRLPTPPAHPSCTYGSLNSYLQTWGTKYRGVSGFYTNSSVCQPTAGYGNYNRINIARVNTKDSLAISFIDGRYNHYCSTFLSANRFCLLVTYNTTDFCAYDYNLSRKWSFPLPYPRSLSLYDSLNFAISLNDAVFVIVDSAANFIYKKKHVNSSLTTIKKINQNKNLICGQIDQGKGIAACMTDSDFNPLWSKQLFMIDSAKNTIVDVFVADNEDIYITTNKFQDSTSYVIRLDNQGSVLAHKQLESTGQKTRIGNITQFGQQMVFHYTVFNGTSTTNVVMGLNQDLSSGCVIMDNAAINSSNFGFTIQDDTTNIPVTYYSGNSTSLGTPGFISSQAYTLECNSTGISLSPDQVTFKVYPNPFKNKIQIECSENMDRISIHNLMGIEIQSVLVKNDIRQLTIETPNIANGVYMLVAHKGDQTVAMKKVVVNND